MKTKSIQLVLSLITLAVAAASPPADELLAQSRAALAANDAKLAVQLAEAAVQAEPARADLHAHLGGAYSVRISQVHLMHQAIMSGKMLSAFEQAVKLDPDHLGARIGLARYYTYAPPIAGGSREKAQAEADAIKQRDPWRGLFELGIIADHFDDREAAFEAFSAAAALRPDDPEVHERMAGVHEKRGERTLARQAYEKALALDPKRPQAQEALARLAASTP